VVLVDAGFPGMLHQIREAMARAGVPFDRLDKVIVTIRTSTISEACQILSESLLITSTCCAKKRRGRT